VRRSVLGKAVPLYVRHTELSYASGAAAYQSARLEAILVRELDDLRAPMTPTDRARRAPERLSPRQRNYLDD